MKRLLISLTVAAGFLGSCSDDVKQLDNTPSPYVNIPLSAGTRSAVNHNNELAFRMLEAEDEVVNPSLCPYSFFSAFAMLAQGDDSASRDEVLRMLGYENGDADGLRDYCSVMNKSLPSIDKNTTVSIANSVWNGSGFALTTDFQNSATDVFQADFFSVGPNTEDGFRQLNEWISNKTFGRIPKMLDSPLAGGVAIVNTMYFNGEWKNRFKTADTRSETFYNADGSQEKIPFMHLSASLTYLSDETLEGVELPYGNGNYSMVVIRNKSNEGVPVLTAQKLDDLLEHSMSSKVNLGMPKYEVSSKRTWDEGMLNKLGLKESLKNGFNGVLNGQTFYLTDVLHGVTVKVDERGTEAAAATVVGGDTSTGLSETVTFDRPFIYLIRETSTNTILFIGKQEQFNK